MLNIYSCIMNLYMRDTAMDQKQWKVATGKVSDDDKKEFFYFRNLAVKELGLRKGYVIHHLRDTEEQRIFNDTYYERWGYDFDGETRTVDVHIRSLRQKLGPAGDMIETVRGVGYRLAAD